MENIDQKIANLIDLGANLPFIEYYPHTQCDMYKILNPYTEYREEKIVLSNPTEGCDKCLDLAIKCISERKDKYYGKV